MLLSDLERQRKLSIEEGLVKKVNFFFKFCFDLKFILTKSIIIMTVFVLTALIIIITFWYPLNIFIPTNLQTS